MRKAITMVLLAMLGIASFGFIAFASADTTIEGTWVRMRGWATDWGGVPVFGWIGAHAGMVNRNGTYQEWARVHATWSYDRPHLNCTSPRLENFTFTVYSARLISTKDVALADGNFTVSGLWNVVEITTTITVFPEEIVQLNSIDIHCEITPLATNATGELQVSTNRMLWVLKIDGIDLLRGSVRVIVIRHWEIKICDVTGPSGEPDDKVDIMDLVRVARRYRAVPGLWNYDHDLDLNFNDEIDMGDIITVAANIGA